MSIAESATSALDQVRQLPNSLSRAKDFLSAVAALQAEGEASFEGVWGSSSALLATALWQHAPAGLVVVCPTAEGIDAAYDDLTLFSGVEPLRFPAWESMPDERLVHDEIYGQRLRTLKVLGTPFGTRRNGAAKPCVATSIQSLLQPVPSPQELSNHTRWLRVGDAFDLPELLRWLAEQRFHATSAVELPGEFSARGGILDLFGPDWSAPVRLELFGDEVASIREFDVSSQRSLRALKEVEITVLRPAQRWAAHFTDYLKSGWWLLSLDPEVAHEHANHYLQLLEEPAESHSLKEVTSRWKSFPLATATGIAEGRSGAAFQLQAESVERFSGEVSRVREELQRVGEGDTVFLVTTTTAEVDRLQEILGSTKLAQAGRLQYVVGFLNEGFRFRAEKAVLVSANELFQRSSLRRLSRRHLGRRLTALSSCAAAISSCT